MKCCNQTKTKKKGQGALQGLLYGLLPHTGCIAFILFSILGITTATTILRPLMMSASFFYWLIGLSFVFATVSAMIYLKKNQLLSFDGLKKKKGYLSVLYGTTISINLLLFMVIFPLVSNIANASSADDAQLGGLRNTTFKVKIPCPGHSPLISESLRNVDGVEWLRFRFPNYFDVRYDSKKTSTSDLLALDVFDSYPALVVSESVS